MIVGDELSRREFLAMMGSLAAAASLRPRRAQRPAFDNLVFVCVDDLNDWISVLRGHPNARTPHIERIARAGMVFTDAHVAAPICNPSRTATYFGISPRRSGVQFNAQDWRACSNLTEQRTIFRHLRASGISTIGMGKVHHAAYNDPRDWDRFFTSESLPKPRRSYPFRWYWSNDGDAKSLEWGAVPTSESGYRLFDDEIGDEACRSLDELGRSKERFALNVGFHRPHLPWIVPRRFYDLFPLAEIIEPFSLQKDLDDVPATARKLANRSRDDEVLDAGDHGKEAVRAYLASIAYADEKLGALFDAYERGPRRNRTAFVFWSDNGFHMGEKEAWRKFTLWQESTRVPLIIVAPGLIKPDSYCHRPVSLLSLYPTLCDLLGLETPAQCEAPSILPLLRDPQAAWDQPVVTALGRLGLAVRTEDWCYIRYQDGEEELYDRGRDPGEYQNLAAARAEELKARLRAFGGPDAVPYDPVEGSQMGQRLGVGD